MSDTNTQQIVENYADAFIIGFCKKALQKSRPWNDYLGILKLPIIFFGGVTPRGIWLRAPAEMNPALWMSKVLYALKLWMFKRQLQLKERAEFGAWAYLLWNSSQNSRQMPRMQRNPHWETFGSSSLWKKH